MKLPVSTDKYFIKGEIFLLLHQKLNALKSDKDSIVFSTVLLISLKVMHNAHVCFENPTKTLSLMNNKALFWPSQ
jgi:hypothetical protein